MTDVCIVKISHYRCGEVDDTTFVFLPVTHPTSATVVSPITIEEDVMDARDSYLENAKAAEHKIPRPKRLSLSDLCDSLPADTTLAEVNRQLAENKEQWGRYHEVVRAKNRTFQDFLPPDKYTALDAIDMDDHRPVCLVEVVVSWGHHHDLTIKYK